ncbi:hypothetical protein KGD82_16705 [Nocardiopsis eucommiae]|uniref:Uncharacterized protein n=1 Tax=Nocardiopsis eucommiae TaxID=2831970 RepID=A0A975L756_9ACTN|nr:hypothetical protein KGD82_16705 [Nocardiopsis eucommiae]
MPAGKSKPRPVRWASEEFLTALDAVYKRRGTTLGAAMNEHGLADIERYGTPEEISLAREHMAARGSDTGRPANQPPAPAAPSPPRS